MQSVRPWLCRKKCAIICGRVRHKAEFVWLIRHYRTWKIITHQKKLCSVQHTLLTTWKWNRSCKQLLRLGLSGRVQRKKIDHGGYGNPLIISRVWKYDLQPQRPLIGLWLTTDCGRSDSLACQPPVLLPAPSVTANPYNIPKIWDDQGLRWPSLVVGYKPLAGHAGETEPPYLSAPPPNLRFRQSLKYASNPTQQPARDLRCPHPPEDGRSQPLPLSISQLVAFTLIDHEHDFF